jgi:predicted HicB family RNase H-like nuclease
MTPKDPPFHLRIPRKLKAKLAKEAQAKPGKVSLNTYLLTLLETHPERQKGLAALSR